MVSDRILVTMDIFPTVMEALGISYGGPLNGISFMPTLLGKEQEKYRDEPLFFTRREGGIRYGGLTIQAVRLGDWKLLQNSPFEARELYNLSEDPKEQNNVIDEYQHIEIGRASCREKDGKSDAKEELMERMENKYV